MRPCTDVTVADIIDLSRPGIAKIADIQPDVVLVDLGQTDPEAAVRMVKSASGLTRLVAFAFDEIDDVSLLAPPRASAATSLETAAPKSYTAP